MKFHVQFQEMGSNGRPIDQASTADFLIEGERAPLVPCVGDYVQVEPVGAPDHPRFGGRVSSRLFRYIGENNCAINIVVKGSPDDDWGAVIKE